MRIIIDTDPGQDDAVAIALALASPEIEVLGITTVAGNVPVASTTRNALKICELMGRDDVLVFAGAARPLVRVPVTAEDVHGASGLDGVELPEPQMHPQAGHAVTFLIDTLRRAEAGTITICALGPLTNLALAFAMAPDIIPRLRRIVAMGGAGPCGGNVTPVAEFNVFADPHAAHCVFQAGVPIVLFPLDVTHQCIARAQHVTRLRDTGGKVADKIADCLAFYGRRDAARHGNDGGPLHDPTVIAWLLEPEMFGGVDVALEVDHQTGPSFGQTIVDFHQVTGGAANVHVIQRADAAAFFDLLINRIGSF